MIAPAALPFLALLVVVVMAATSLLWAGHLATTAWIVLVRRRGFGWWLVTLTGAILALSAGVLHLVTGAWLAAEAAVLAIWLTPFVAVPALNLLARAQAKDDDPAPVPGKDGKLSWRTIVFDTERARLRRAYEPPPLAEDDEVSAD